MPSSETNLTAPWYPASYTLKLFVSYMIFLEHSPLIKAAIIFLLLREHFVWTCWLLTFLEGRKVSEGSLDLIWDSRSSCQPFVFNSELIAWSMLKKVNCRLHPCGYGEAIICTGWRLTGTAATAKLRHNIGWRSNTDVVWSCNSLLLFYGP